MITTRLGFSLSVFVFSAIMTLPVFAQVTLPASQLDSTRSVSYERNVTTGQVTAEITDSGSAQHCKRTEYLYDSVGNRTSATVKNCTTPAAAGTAIFAARASTDVYAASGENPVGAYPNTVTNAAGHVESRVHHNAFGGVISLIDAKGLTNLTTYDGFGRKTLSIYPDGNKLSYSYQYCSATGLVSVPTGQTAQASCPASAAMLIVESPLNAANAANGAQKLSYIDAQGRVISKRTVITH